MMPKIKAVLCSVLFVMLFGCDKSDIEGMYDSPINLSSVGVINAVPGSIGMDVFVNKIKLNKTTEKLVFGEHIPYRNTYTGEVEFSLTSYSGTKQEMYSGRLTFVPSKIYSVFVYKEGDLKLLQSEDNVLLPAKGQAKLRIVHLGGNVASLKVFSSDKEIDFQNVKYKDVSAFVSLAINKSYNLEITDGNADVKVELNFEPQNQGIYTLLVKGDKKSVVEGLGIDAKVIKH